MAGLTISPTEGAFGTTINLTGTGFAVSTNITVTYAGITVVTTPSTITTDGSGNFTGSIVPPNYTYDENEIIASDGTDTASATFNLTREPEYCTVADVADSLRITINSNTDPNTKMVKDWIIENEDEMDYTMGHTFLKERQVTEVLSVPPLWDFGRGMPLLVRHRNIKPFDISKGDKLEVWTGAGYQDRSNSRLIFEEINGVLYVKGYTFTILRKLRFRITYRYGGNQTMQAIPKDIKRACRYLTMINILETDYKMSLIGYGGEGAIDKDKLIEKYQKKADDIIRKRSEIIVQWN